MTDCCTPNGCRQIFSEKNAAGEAKRYRRKGLDGSFERIPDLIRERGVEGKTLLEVGGGIGAIEIELLRAGMAQAVNVELTPTYEAAATELNRAMNVLIHARKRCRYRPNLGQRRRISNDIVGSQLVPLVARARSQFGKRLSNSSVVTPAILGNTPGRNP